VVVVVMLVMLKVGSSGWWGRVLECWIEREDDVGLRFPSLQGWLATYISVGMYMRAVYLRVKYLVLFSF
jgi:hypothetical protein